MNQQLAIIILVDINSAIKAQTLNDNVYLFDNTKLPVSEGKGTPNLVSSISGTHWIDGSQANEQVINWLPYGMGLIPPTLPSTFYHDYARGDDSRLRLNKHNHFRSKDYMPKIRDIMPIITNITGEAVDQKVIYPAVYGSPNLVNDGWYWSASVDSSKPGKYSYIIHLQLSHLVFTDQSWSWEPVHMQCEAWIKVNSSPKVNGFTGAGMGLLPII